MLKHPQLTESRIEQFVETGMASQIVLAESPLNVEFCGTAHPDQTSAEQGPWEPVQPGFRYGPAYRMVWFRVSGAIPDDFVGGDIGLVADVGGERTVWQGGVPYIGLDHEHQVMPMSADQVSATRIAAKPGQRVEFLIQAYTRNPQCRVHGRELPREAEVETMSGAKVVLIDSDLCDLYYDCAFSRSLLKTLDAQEPGYHVLLRALNSVVNQYEKDNRETIARCRKLLRDAWSNVDGDIRHTVFPVGHAHLDTAWLWPLAITRLKMAHTTANQLRLIERYPEYVFVHSQASQYEWLEKEYPGLFEQVKAAVDRGQWEPVGSMWVEADCNISGGEALVRQFLYGRRYFREKLGYETHDMWLPDVFGYSAALPQILAKFGIKYFLTQKISWNQTNKFPHNTFWWKGIDGSRVWTHFPPADTYNGDATPREIVASVRKHRDHGRSDASLYIFGHGDGGGGPTEKMLEFMRRSRLSGNMPDVQSGKKAIDFFRSARARSRDLAEWSGELYLEFHRGTYTSQAANKKGNRFSEFLLRDAEWLACFHPDFPNSYPAERLEAAWKLLLLNQFHDILPGSSVREVYEDSDRDYAQIRSEASAVIGDCLLAIADRIDRSGMHRPVALFQSATVSGQGSIDWNERSEPQSIVAGDESLPVQVVEEFGERKLVFPVPAAALGSVCVADLSNQAPATRIRLKGSPRKIENGELAVRFDGHGNITSIQSLEDGTEFVEPGQLANLFQLFEDKPLFWSAWDIDQFAFETGKDLVRSESVEVVEKGPVRTGLEVVKKFGRSTIRQRITVGASPGVRFDTEVDWHEEDKLLKVAFPINVNAGRATYEIQFGNVERATHRNTSWDMARFEVPAQKWIDLSEGDQGVALLNDCKYGFDVVGNVMRMTLLRAPKAPDPECDMGRHRFTYVLMPHFGPYNYAGVVQSAYALNAPVRWAMLEPGAGAEGHLPPLVAVEDRNIVIESVKKSEQGDYLIVRLYECHNSRGLAELSCFRKVREAWLTDLEENNVQELEVVDGLVPFSYKPFEIVTIKLRV
ncbi:MAG: alpha-mannosidase [Fimbriimonadaceae bacterium]